MLILLAGCEFSLQVLEVLETRNDLIEACFKFVPQARKRIHASKFFSYPVIACILVASAIGLSKMKK